MKIKDVVLTRPYRLKIITIALLIGLVAGVISIIYHTCLQYGIALVQSCMRLSPIVVCLLPFLVYGLLYMTNRLSKVDNVAFGAQAVEYELKHINHLTMKPRSVLIKLSNTIVTLACGFAVGQFGPMLHLGGSIGSNIGYAFNLPKSVIRAMVGCGVAAAISAIMQTPLFATIFVIEVIFSKRYFDYMLPVLTSSLVAYAINLAFVGRVSVFQMGTLDSSFLMAPHDWVVLIVLGLTLGIVASVYVYALRRFESCSLSPNNSAKDYVVCASAFALLYVVFPLAHYFDIHQVQAIASSPNGLWVLVLLLIVRLLATSTQLGSGLYGGNFSPGIALGAIVGVIFSVVAPKLGFGHLDTGHFLAFSVAGMLSGFAHAPISAVILVIELVRDVSILAPALLVALISYLVSDIFIQDNVYSLK